MMKAQKITARARVLFINPVIKDIFEIQATKPRKI